MCTSNNATAGEVSWAEARQRLAEDDLDNVMVLYKFLRVMTKDLSRSPETFLVVLVGSALNAQADYNDVDLIVLPRYGYELNFSEYLRSGMHEFCNQTSVVRYEHDGDCYVEKEGWVLTLAAGGNPLHVLTFHPRNPPWGGDTIAVNSEDFLAIEAQRPEPRPYAIVEFEG